MTENETDKHRRDVHYAKFQAMHTVIKCVLTGLIDSIAVIEQDELDHYEVDDPRARLLLALQDALDVLDPPEPLYHLRRESRRDVLRRIIASRRDIANRVRPPNWI